MGHFDYTRPGGVWSGSATVTTAEIEDLDSKTERAINGDEGGTWTPSSVITIGGSGWTVTGPSTLDDCQEITMTGATGIVVESTSRITIESGAGLDIDPGGLLVASGDIVFTSGAELTLSSGAVLTVQGGAEIDVLATADIDVAGTINIQSGGELNTASGGSVFLGAGTSYTRQCTETMSGNGARTVYRTASATNTNTTPDVSADIWLITINDGNPYAATLDVSSPIPTLGERLTVRKLGTSGTLNVASEGPIPLCSIGPGQSGAVSCLFDGTQWRVESVWRSDYSGVFSTS